MDLITILTRCHRFRGFVYQHAHFSADKKSIEVAVRPRKGSAAVCSRCHLPAPGYDKLADRRFECIPLWVFSSSFFLHYAARPLSPLRHCGCRRSSLGRRQTHTDQSLHALLSPLGAATVMERNRPGLPHFLGKVFDAVESVVTWGLEHRILGQIDAIGVDEIQYAKGHKYLTLVYQIDLGVTRLLWVGKERTIESFQGFFTAMGQEVISKICFVCTDMWEPYLKADSREMLRSVAHSRPFSYRGQNEQSPR
jgi:transposase